ncbi:Non-catalytic module family DOC2, partial [Piromyces sp. E2]
CWATRYGYPCCKNRDTELIYYSKTAGKYYGVENDEWCGITDLQICPSGHLYKCCSDCNVVYTDTEEWGIENDDWCSIPHSCKEQNEN